MSNNINLVIDPSLLTPDDNSGNTVAIEIWARVEFVAGTSNSTLLTYAQPRSVSPLPLNYTEEFGSAGKTVTLPSSGTHRRFVRLGTIRLPTDQGRYFLAVVSLGGGSSPSYDYLLLLPSNARALSPSGRANDASYPDFVPITSELTRRIRADLSGTLKEPATGAPDSLAPGLGGSLLELPPEDLEMVVKLSSLVPDDPTSDTTDEQLLHSATVHLAVTPRWRLGRSS